MHVVKDGGLLRWHDSKLEDGLQERRVWLLLLWWVCVGLTVEDLLGRSLPDGHLGGIMTLLLSPAPISAFVVRRRAFVVLREFLKGLAFCTTLSTATFGTAMAPFSTVSAALSSLIRAAALIRLTRLSIGCAATSSSSWAWRRTATEFLHFVRCCAYHVQHLLCCVRLILGLVTGAVGEGCNALPRAREGGGPLRDVQFGDRLIHASAFCFIIFARATMSVWRALSMFVFFISSRASAGRILSDGVRGCRSGRSRTCSRMMEFRSQRKRGRTVAEAHSGNEWRAPRSARSTMDAPPSVVRHRIRTSSTPFKRCPFNRDSSDILHDLVALRLTHVQFCSVTRFKSTARPGNRGWVAMRSTSTRCLAGADERLYPSMGSERHASRHRLSRPEPAKARERRWSPVMGRQMSARVALEAAEVAAPSVTAGLRPSVAVSGQSVSNTAPYAWHLCSADCSRQTVALLVRNVKPMDSVDLPYLLVTNFQIRAFAQTSKNQMLSQPSLDETALSRQ